MIVVDVNVLAYLIIPGPLTAAAENALRKDAEWVAPALRRHEFLNVLATSVRHKIVSLEQADQGLARVDEIVSPVELSLPDREIIRTAVESSHATYDCEYVVAARVMGLRLLTEDRKLAAKFSDVCVTLQQYLEESK